MRAHGDGGECRCILVRVCDWTRARACAPAVVVRATLGAPPLHLFSFSADIVHSLCRTRAMRRRVRQRARRWWHSSASSLFFLFFVSVVVVVIVVVVVVGSLAFCFALLFFRGRLLSSSSLLLLLRLLLRCGSICTHTSQQCSAESVSCRGAQETEVCCFVVVVGCVSFRRRA